MTLRDELNAKENSFLLELRINLNWNHTSFINLITEINKECKQSKENQELPRDIASGIWYISSFIKDWSEHPSFPKKFSSTYFELAYELIDDLAYFYFLSESPYQSDTEIENKTERLKTLIN